MPVIETERLLLPAASIGVLNACGFTPSGPGAEAGAVRYELVRGDWRSGIRT